MSMSDPIADMLTRVRNALQRQHPSVSMPYSKTKEAIAQVLKEEGYIEDCQVLPQKPRDVLQLELKYVGGRRDQRPVITGLERVSKPGRRHYVGKNDIPWVLSGMGISVLTTSKGIMTGQQARRQGVGGEVICRIW
ncbi:MAG: 30S ribosomal protein S8 [Anaerolineaceae bacterium]|jgi:small subunit ribosomal protein S8|nr:30S ribosomal protein S8 [Chloroflexota bacterium]UCC54169.1 MAG: 30S ribosomal protein S8 [Anaerolineaceae bacterium]